MFKKLCTAPWMKVALVSAGLSFGTTALADAPWVSGPSITKLGDSVTLSGGNLPANEAVAVIVTPPSGDKYRHIQVVDPGGKLDYALTVTAPGAYTVEIANQNDQTLGTATVRVSP